MFVFELNDVTDEETYYPLGVWNTLEQAISAIDECKSPDNFPNENSIEDYCKIELRERQIGWSGAGKRVFLREYTKEYIEDKDEYVWRVR